MARSHLRIYTGPDSNADITTIDHSVRKATVTVPLGDLVATLVDAHQKGRIWVKDFENEEVTIPTDLYEIVLAYQHYHRPSA
ncbi:MAG: hypothetical protein R3C28_02200 [Pirellulaceae bacterium]